MDDVFATTARDEARARARQRATDGVFAVALAASPILTLLVARPFGIVFPKAFYLPVHTALEALVAAAGLATFAVQWFAAGKGAFREARARFIGPAFLGAAFLELAHLLAFPGMPGFFGPASTERGIAYWLAARALSVGALLAAARIERESESPLLRRGRMLAAILVLVAIVFAAELSLPDQRAYFFVEGRGLTPLKIFLEATVAVAATLGALLHLRAWVATRDDASGKLALSLAMAVFGEICFMLYTHAYDPFNVLGHAYLAVSFWFVFDALFVAALVRPYRDLDRLRAHVEDELVVTIRRLRQTTEQREDLLRAVSHDLRNPLQIVMLQAQRLLRIAEDPVRRPSTAIVTATRRMDRMLRDLSDSARAESGNLELSREPVDLRPFVAELLASSDGVLDVGRVENAVPDRLPMVLADPDRLDRILTNLVGNALKYSPGRVIVQAEGEGGEVRVSVADKGQGIGPDDLPRVFDRYYRGQRHEGEGLGLGLYIVRKLVEAHGGKIWAESRPGVGSTFTFTLPATGAEQRAARGAQLARGP
jgi:signal transduction histidine kinase